jgi:hypothetical protein
MVNEAGNRQQRQQRFRMVLPFAQEVPSAGDRPFLYGTFFGPAKKVARLPAGTGGFKGCF